MKLAGQWWHTPLIPALRRKRQWISEFKARVLYKFQDAQSYMEKPCFKKQNKRNQNKQTNKNRK